MAHTLISITMAVIGGDMAMGAMKGLFQLGSTGMQMASGKRQQERNFKYTQQLARDNFAYQSALMDKANKMNIENEKIADSLKVQSLKNAGLNPMLAYGGSSPMPIVGGSQPSSGIVNYENPMAGFGDLPEKVLNNEFISAQIKNLESQTRKNNTESDRNDIENTFLGSVNDLKIQLTNEQYQNAIYLQGYYADNPELLQAVADEKHLQNQNIIANYDNLVKNLEYLDSSIAKNHSERAYLTRKQLSLDVQDMFTRENILYLRDQNVRENYRSPGWLIDEMARIQKSDMADDVKIQRLSILSSMYDQASGRTTLLFQAYSVLR